MKEIRFRKQVVEAHKKAYQHDGFRERFFAEPRDIFRPHTATGFVDQLDLKP